MITDKKIDEWINRKKIPIYASYIEKANRWDKTKKEVNFKFYRCDYCGAAIVIKKKIQDQNGGEFELGLTRLRRGHARVVTHSCCLNKLLNELEKFFEDKEKKK